MSKTIINQGAASPLALLEAFRLVVVCTSEPVSFEDACHLLGPHDWKRLEEKNSAWRNAVEDSQKVQAASEFQSLGVAPPSPNTSVVAQWLVSRRLKSQVEQMSGGEIPQAVKLLRDSTVAIENVLFDSAPAPTVLRELIDLRIAEERPSDGMLQPAAAWSDVPDGVPSDWFFAKLLRYFFREWSDNDLNYRLLAYSYRAWLDKVEPDGDGVFSILRGRMDAALFIEFNEQNAKRLGIAMNLDKLRAWTRAVCQMGLGWIVGEGEKDGTGAFERPFPDPSLLIEWCLDDILKPGREIPLDDFVTKFGNTYPVLDYSSAAVLPFGLSFALRALHDSGIVEMRFEGDARAKVRLSDDPAHRIPRANRIRRPK